MPMESWMHDELLAQLEDHETVVVLSEGSGKEIDVTNIQYDSTDDRVVIYVST